MKIFKLLILIYIFVVSISIIAQDTQYWLKQYGTYGELLGGTVVGAVSDLSSTYYNPGSMAFTTDSALILTTYSLQLYSISVNQAFGTNGDLSSTSINSSSGIFAIRLPKWLGDEQIAISYIARYDFQFDAKQQNVTPYSGPQKSYDAIETSAYESLTEYWPGITWSKAITNNIGIGATLYFPYRSQTTRNQALTQSIDSTGTNSSIILFEDYRYFNLRSLLKFGASFKLSPLMLGITITTPSFNLFGSGSTALNFSTVNIDDDIFDDDIFDDLPTFASDIQEELPTKFRSSLSIAVGAAYYLENTSFYFSAEWFNSVGEFNIMDPEPFYAQSSGEEIKYNTAYSLNSVFNFGLGIKYIFNPDFTYYGSITTDQTAFVHGKENKFALSNWDIIHLRSGGQFNVNRLSITLGLGYGFEANVDEGLKIFRRQNPEGANVSYNQLDVVFGFSYKL